MPRRAFVVVLDACGVGALPDAAEYGDKGTETDQLYGHRHDVEGFHRGLQEIDASVGAWLELLTPGDLLVLTADHGCDPDSPRTDHTREYGSVLAAFEGHRSRRHDESLADVGASVLAWLTGGSAERLPGRSFL